MTIFKDPFVIVFIIINSFVLISIIINITRFWYVSKYLKQQLTTFIKLKSVIWKA